MSYFVPITTALRDAFLDDNAIKYIKVVVDTDTFTPVSLSGDASEDYERWTFSLKNRSGISVGQYANDECSVLVSHDNATWVTVFTGFVSDEGFRRTRGAVTDDFIDVDLVNATKRKGTKRVPDPALLAGFTTVDTASESTSVLHHLASLMGVTVSTSDVTYTHDIVEIGKKTVWEELQSLKEAFHADMYFRYDGKLLFRTPLEDSYSAPSSEWTFQCDPANAVSGNACRVRGRLQETFLPVRCNYAKTSFNDYTPLSSRVIYKNTENYQEATGYIDIEVAAGAYWPGPNAGDVGKLMYSDPDSGESYPYADSIDTPTIGATGSGNDIEYTGGTLTLVSFNGSTSATVQGADHSQIILRNTGATTCTIRKLTITGEPYRLESDTTVEHIDSAVTDAVDFVQQDIDGTYMINQSQAFDTLYHIVEEGKGRPRRFAFSAPFMPWIQRRAIVSVQPVGESAVRCVVNTYSHKNNGRTGQGFRTSIVCTELGTHTPTGSPYVSTTPQTPAWQAKLTSISDNASATYRTASTSAPTNPQLGDYWYQTDTQLTKRYAGSVDGWQNVGASPLEESSTSGVAFETSSGKVKIYDDGSFEFGSLNAAKNAGGIGYDVTNDRLYGNVAYDQWDLVVETNDDLALLTTGTTSYPMVLITPGNYTASAKINLDAHGVVVLRGVNVNSCKIEFDYILTLTELSYIYGGSELIEISNLEICGTTSQNQDVARVIDVSNSTGALSTTVLRNLYIHGFYDKLIGVKGYFSQTSETCLQDSYLTELKTGVSDVGRCINVVSVACGRGFDGCNGLVNCSALSNAGYGFYQCTNIVNSYAKSNDYGFGYCSRISSSYSYANSTGFYRCSMMSTCRSKSNTSYGISTCEYISSTESESNTTADWYSNTYVDSNSCNV